MVVALAGESEKGGTTGGCVAGGRREERVGSVGGFLGEGDGDKHGASVISLHHSWHVR